MRVIKSVMGVGDNTKEKRSVIINSHIVIGVIMLRGINETILFYFITNKMKVVALHLPSSIAQL